jgi:hypothetical protein
VKHEAVISKRHPATRPSGRRTNPPQLRYTEGNLFVGCRSSCATQSRLSSDARGAVLQWRHQPQVTLPELQYTRASLFSAVFGA